MHTLKLAEWRQFRGLTKAELARRSGIDYMTLWRIEHGRLKRGPWRDTMQRLAAALDAEPRHLWAAPPSADAEGASQSFTSPPSAAGDPAKVLAGAGQFALDTV